MWVEIFSSTLSAILMGWACGLYAPTMIDASAQTHSSNCAPCCIVGWGQLSNSSSHSGSMSAVPCRGMMSNNYDSSNTSTLVPCCREVNMTMHHNSSIVPCCEYADDREKEQHGWQRSNLTAAQEGNMTESDALVRVSGGYVRGVVSYLGGKNRPAHIFRVRC